MKIVDYRCSVYIMSNCRQHGNAHIIPVHAFKADDVQKVVEIITNYAETMQFCTSNNNSSDIQVSLLHLPLFNRVPLLVCLDNIIIM